jgi:hypothetical protein
MIDDGGFSMRSTSHGSSGRARALMSGSRVATMTWAVSAGTGAPREGLLFVLLPWSLLLLSSLYWKSMMYSGSTTVSSRMYLTVHTVITSTLVPCHTGTTVDILSIYRDFPGDPTQVPKLHSLITFYLTRYMEIRFEHLS